MGFTPARSRDLSGSVIRHPLAGRKPSQLEKNSKCMIRCQSFSFSKKHRKPFSRICSRLGFGMDPLQGSLFRAVCSLNADKDTQPGIFILGGSLSGGIWFMIRVLCFNLKFKGIQKLEKFATR